MYSRDEVLKASLEYFNGATLPSEVFTDKYALQNNGIFYELVPNDMFRRLAREFARIEARYENPLSEEEIYTWLSGWWLIPQGSPMSGIGNKFQLQSLSNCFVIEPAQDSYGGIFRADQQQAQIMKRRGGVGHDISNIRPKGMATSNAARTTDGIGVFMDRFSNTTREVAQGGRRGALMLTISSRHPEISTFINIKKDKTRVTGANVSIRVDDEFMRAVRDKTSYTLQWPVDSKDPVVQKEVDASALWDEMMQAAWESAEPGILFWDTAIKYSPADCYADVGFKSTSTNPCGEIILSSNDSCRLLLLNLTKFVIDPYTAKARFDYENFERAVRVAQRLMDDLVDLELEAIEKIIAKIKSDPEDEIVKAIELDVWQKAYKAAQDGRRTGLGETGLGDTIAMMNLRYGSDDSIKFTEKVHKTLAIQSYAASILMAKERGAFGVFDYEKEKDHVFVSNVVKNLPEDLQETYRTYGRRNIANLTIPPAGSMSIMAQLGFFPYFGITSGCEPAYLIDYKRRKKIMSEGQVADFVDDLGDRWQEYNVYHNGHKAWAEVNGKDPEKDIAMSPYWKATSADINWVRKVDVQAAAQRWVDHSISNTTNVPKDTDVNTVKEIYMRGWETGCKGITIYREETRSGVMLSKDANSTSDIQETNAPKRPLELPCDIHRARVKGEEYLILVGLLNGKPYEIFCGLAKHMDLGKKEKSGILYKVPQKNGIAHYNLVTQLGDTFENIAELFDNPDYGAFTRTLSTSLRHGVPVRYIVEQLRKDKHSTISSFSSVIARVLGKSYIADGTKAGGSKKCPDCGSSNLSYQQGCVGCIDCGSSKCG